MIIGFCGKKGSGKSFFAKYLVKQHNFIELTFAEPLKKAVQIIFNLTDDELHDQNLKENKIERLNASPREILQWLGTDIIREKFNKKFNYNGSIWVDNMKEKLKNLQDKNVVISDVRFQNEIDLIHSLNGIIINIQASGTNIDLSDTKKHKSENQKLNYDYQIYNSFDIEITENNYELLSNLIN